MKTQNITKVGLLMLLLIGMSIALLGCNDSGHIKMSP